MMAGQEIDGRLVRVSGRIYQALLVAYPKRFRHRYASQMVQLFRDQCREELGRGGVSALVVLWVRTFFELVVTAIAQRSRAERSPLLALFLSLLVVGLGQVYNRQMVKGLPLVLLSAVWMFLVFGVYESFGSAGDPTRAFAIAWFAGVLIQVWSMWDAYRVAERTNIPLKIN